MATWKTEVKGADLKNLKKFVQNIEKLKQYRVKVGVLGGNYATGESIASVALKHEFGSRKPHTFKYKGEMITIKSLPTRSFLRVPLRLKIRTLSKMDEVEHAMLIRGLLTGQVQHPLYMLGLKGEKIVQKAFDTQGFGQWPRNISQRYVELKGSDVPLIDTGHLRKSISSEVYRRS